MREQSSADSLHAWSPRSAPRERGPDPERGPELESGPDPETIPAGVVPAAGVRLGPYRVCFEIGAGGMATVFLAAACGRAGVHRFVALKCLKPELACQPEFAAMFLDEARVASQIHHPHVCSVLDFDQASGVSYMVMEHVAGESLSALRRRLADELTSWEPVTHAALVARIVADAGEGLHAAHELVDVRGEPASVVHRDVAPDNLMLTYDGCVKVLDFGVSLSCQNRQRTRSGVVKGKISYMAPEVLQGRRPDRRSDVWALGVVAWELLTGQRLFDEATDLETLRAVGEKDIPPPSRIRRGLPAGLDKIVLRALARDPERRFATARELSQQMNRFLANRRIAFGLAELSAAMDRLFPSGRAAKRELLDAAEQQGEEGDVLPIETAEILIEEPLVPPAGALAQVAQRARDLARRHRRWWPGLAAAAAAGLLITAWSSWRHRGPVDPAAFRPAALAVEPPAAGRGSGYELSVSPVEARGDTVLLRVQMVPAARLGVAP
jgi:serine/threonine protein kinase